MLASPPRQIARPSAEEVADALLEVLARPEFQPARAEPARGLLARAVRWIVEALGRLIPEVPTLPGGPILNAIAIAALAVGAALVAPRLVSGRRGRRRPAGASAPGDQPATTGTAIERTAEEWEARARQHLASGQAREAALALYQAVLRRFADAGLIRYHTSKTPGDYRREIAGAPVAGPYAAFLRGFEPLAFGRVPQAEGALPGLFSLARDAAPSHG